MKLSPFSVSLALCVLSACATAPSPDGQEDQSAGLAPAADPAAGPLIMNAHADPATVQMSASLQPITTAAIVAEIQDRRSNITDVRLRFAGVPIEVPMVNVGGTTWRAKLTPRQLQLLAVTGRTIQYNVNIVAKDDDNRTGVTQIPVQLAIETPDAGST